MVYYYILNHLLISPIKIKGCLNMKQNIWEKAYVEVNNLWGLEPNNIFSRYIDIIPKDGSVLDIGVGEGRNALFFANLGYKVAGIDISETAINRCLDLSKRFNFQIDAKVADITTFDINKEEYSLIILSNVLNFFSVNEIKKIVEKLKNGLKDNGLIYISVFDNEEPSITKVKQRFSQIADFTFYDEKTNMYHHYFTQEELKNLVAEFDTISYSKSYSLDLTHGKPHYHSGLEILSKKVKEVI